MSENLAEHYALPTPQEEVEDEITEQRSMLAQIGAASGAGEARDGKGYSR